MQTAKTKGILLLLLLFTASLLLALGLALPRHTAPAHSAAAPAHGQAGTQPPQEPGGQDGARPRQHQPEAGADHGDHAVQLLGGRQLLQGIFSEQLGHARHSLSQIWATAHGLTIKSQKYTHISSKILR